MSRGNAAGELPAAGAGSDSPTSLVRGIGRWGLILLLVNAVIGAGILGLPSTVFALAQSYSILALLFSVVTLSLVALCIAELGSRYTHTGGPYVYAQSAFGPLPGFLVGWLLWVSRLFSFASITNLVISYGAGLFGVTFTPAIRALLIFVIIVALGAILLRGIRETTHTNNLFAWIKIILLGGFVVTGVFFVDTERFAATAMPPPADFVRAAMLWVFALVGFEGVSIMAGESHDPRREIPIATVGGLLLVAAIYLSVLIVAVGTLPDLAGSEQPIAEAAGRFLGGGGAKLIAIGAIAMMLGTLYAIYLIATRSLFALAEQASLPSPLAAVHPRSRTPHVAIVTTGVVMAAVTLFHSFITALALAALIRTLVYAASVAAMLRIRRAPHAPPARFELRGGTLIAILALLACALLVQSSSGTEAITVAAVLVIGSGVFLLERWRRGRGSKPSAGRLA